MKNNGSLFDGVPQAWSIEVGVLLNLKLNKTRMQNIN